MGISWEEVYAGKVNKFLIDSMNSTASLRAKNRRINSVITNTEKEYGEANKSIHFYQKLFKLEYDRLQTLAEKTHNNISYKLIISKFDENYTITSSFPPIVGPNTGQLIASIPHFIMQAPNESNEIARWENKIVDLEKRLSEWEVNAPMGDSLTTFWGTLSEYYFSFYAQ